MRLYYKLEVYNYKAIYIKNIAIIVLQSKKDKSIIEAYRRRRWREIIKNPNIVVFFTDQQRWDTIGTYGSEAGLTPYLDKMADEGVKFEYAYTPQPVCGPARACIQTGRYATANRCYRNDIDLDSEEKTMSHYLKDAGYDVGYIGKWHLAGTKIEPVPIEKRGGYIDYWLGADLLEFTSGPFGGIMFDQENNPVEFKKYRPDAMTDYAINYIKGYKKENPFLLFISYLEPHHQNDLNRYVAPKGYAQRYKDAPVPQDLIELDTPDADWEQNIADYYGMCKNLDENLERLRVSLKELGQLENTIIIFTSDHGSHFRTRNGEYKRSCHEASVRIPMIVCGGEFSGGKVIDNLVSLVDIPPTVLDIAGIKKPDLMQGHSLKKLLSDTTDWEDVAFIQISESQVARSIRTRRWKYCVTAPHKDGWNDSWSDWYVDQYLYDLEADPYELNNLVWDRQYEGICKELEEILVKKMVEVGEQKPKIIRIYDNIDS